MLHKKEHPRNLRNRVTSKGGTTDAAIKFLMSSDKFLRILESAITKAKKRSIKLS